jgi:anti-sigma factor RsiW
MKHRTEEELIAYRDGEPKERIAIAAHLQECAECREELARIEAVFGALDAMPVPDPGEDYEERAWQRIAPRLGEKKLRWWKAFLVPQRLAALGGVVALLILAFVAGRWTKPQIPVVDQPDAAKVRERVLVVAVGEHLGRTEMVLMELENAPPQKDQKAINISETQRRAEDLVQENRLYRQTALKEGDQAMASTLDELERVLLDIANSPEQLTPAAFETIRKRIQQQGLLFKVRVVKQGLDERKANPDAKPAENQAMGRERKKV